MSDTHVDTPKGFQDRLKERIQRDIGELITNEELAVLIEKAIEESFFKPEEVEHGNRYHGNYRKEEKPSWFVREVTKAMEPMLKEEVQKYVDSHSKDIKIKVAELLKDQSVMILVSTAVTKTVMGTTNDQMLHFQSQIFDLQQKLGAIGR